MSSDSTVTVEKREEVKVNQKVERCPLCGNNRLAHEGGCLTCYACGWSKCS